VRKRAQRKKCGDSEQDLGTYFKPRGRGLKRLMVSVGCDMKTILLLAICVIMFGCGGSDTPRPTSIEREQLLDGAYQYLQMWAPMPDVVELLGEPNEIVAHSNTTIWIYYITNHPEQTVTTMVADDKSFHAILEDRLTNDSLLLNFSTNGNIIYKSWRNAFSTVIE
jgi:hypothetical protein